jgi:protein Mpv17
LGPYIHINFHPLIYPFTRVVIFGPAATTWFKFLQNKIVLRNKNLEIAARVAADQTLFAPTNLFFFLSSMAIMEGSSPKDKLDSTYKGALQTNWMVWPFVQVINFKFVPLHHRVLLVNVISLGWNCYLSFLNSQGQVKVDEKETKVINSLVDVD